MKKLITILAMLLIAATSYNQSSRRTANSEQTAQRNEARSNNASANHSVQDRNERKDNTSRSDNTQVNTRRTNTGNSQGRTETQSIRSRESSATSTSRSRNNTNTQRSNTQVTNNTSRRGTSDSEHTTPHRSTSGTYVRSSGNQNTVYVSTRRYTGTHTVVHHYHTPPPSREYRAKHYAYRIPVSLSIIWTPAMHGHYIRFYPLVTYWHYSYGYRIANVSAYFAEYYMGEVMTVYGRISEVYYSRSTDEYFLYYGPYYPYQDFTVVIPGWIARQYSRRPERYFDNRYLAVTGLIASFQGEPEIIVNESFQIHLY